MNEFFLANNRSIKIGDIIIRQFQMYDFDEWAPVAKVIKDFIKNHSDEIYKSLLKAHTAEVITLLSKSTHQDETALISMVEASESLLIQLVDAMFKVNNVFFSEKEPKRKSKRKSQSEDTDQANWFDNFQILIESGHRHKDIMRMSYGTFIGYLKAAQRQQSANIRMQTSLMRAAQHANAKAFAKLIDELKLSED